MDTQISKSNKNSACHASESWHPDSNIHFRTNAVQNLNINHNAQVVLQEVGNCAWLWLIMIILLFSGGCLWAVFDHIVVSLQAPGLILPQDGKVISIFAKQAGEISFVGGMPDKIVNKESLLAVITNPHLDADLSYLKQRHQEEKLHMDQSINHFKIRKEYLNRQFDLKETQLKDKLNFLQQQYIDLEKLYAQKAQLFKKSLVTITDLNQSKEEYRLVQDNINKAQLELLDLPIKLKEAQNNLDEQLRSRIRQYKENEQALKHKILAYHDQSKVMSTVNGIVMTSNIVNGDYVLAGKPLFSIMTPATSDQLEALLFIQHHQGKKIAVGMDVRVLPNTAWYYAHGYIKGKISSISEYPLTKASAYSYLGNMELVQQYFNQGAPFIARVRLLSSNKTISHLLWTTRHGAPFKINPGTPLTANVIAKVCTPIQILIKRC